MSKYSDWSSEQLDEYLDTVLIGGQEVRSIEIVDYRPQWVDGFTRERAKLARLLGQVARSIEHVGSTAVPGLAAKPIIDIMVTVEDPDDETGYRSALEQGGYVLRVREPGHRMFRTEELDIHVHIWKSNSDDERRHLMFRDQLRSNEDDRLEYELAKRRLAGRFQEMNHYAQAKSEVIERILRRSPGKDPR